MTRAMALFAGSRLADVAVDPQFLTDVRLDGVEDLLRFRPSCDDAASRIRREAAIPRQSLHRGT
jgi:hypothetical protein